MRQTGARPTENPQPSPTQLAVVTAQAWEGRRLHEVLHVVRILVSTSAPKSNPRKPCHDNDDPDESLLNLHVAAGCGVLHITVLDVVSGSVRPSAQAAGDTAAAAGR